jgi:hypothetical protein
MRPQLTNEKACSENVVSSVALRVQPSLAKEPTPVRAYIDPPRIVDPIIVALNVHPRNAAK